MASVYDIKVIEIGEQGPAGATGPAGPTGAQGPQGIQGVQGETGPAGATGPQGIQGPVGPAGADGIDGAVGPQGETGPAGATGPQGIQGPAGPAGADGSDGSDGDSAYQVAVNNGFVGTEEQWLESLVGPQGIQGETGPAGADGADGTNGVGVPTGGTTEQILSKIDGTDYNTHWVDKPSSGATTLDGLSDVTITTPSTGQVIKYNGSGWINDTDATGSGSPIIATPSFSTSMTIDVSGLVDIVRFTMTDNSTIGFTGGTDGQRVVVEVTQDATGSRLITWASSVRFGTDITSITLSTTGNKTDRVGLIYNSTAGKYDVVAYVRGF